MPHYLATCTLCSDIGTLGRDPGGGGPIYCGCRRGLEAHINHLAYVIQRYAETLTIHKTRKEKGLITLSDEEVADIEFAQRVTLYAHDELEKRRIALVHGERGADDEEPEMFPDYDSDGDLLIAT